MSPISRISDFYIQCKYLEKFKSNRATKNRRRKSKVFCMYGTVALRPYKVVMGDRRATVPYMQKTFDLRRGFFVARFDLNFSKYLHCI